MLLLLVSNALTRSLVKVVPAANAVCIPDWLQFATVLSLCKINGIFTHSKSMVKTRKFLGRADNSFRSAGCNVNNTVRSESRCALRLRV
jgi:hypothetical protein